MTHNDLFERIRRWYRQGLWTEEQVRQAAEKGAITQAEAEQILKEGRPHD